MHKKCWVRWYVFSFQVLRRWGWEAIYQVKANLGYIERPHLENKYVISLKWWLIWKSEYRTCSHLKTSRKLTESSLLISLSFRTCPSWILYVTSLFERNYFCLWSDITNDLPVAPIPYEVISSMDWGLYWSLYGRNKYQHQSYNWVYLIVGKVTES